MKNPLSKLLGIIAVSAILFSCQSTKNLAYFDDIERDQFIYGVSQKAPEYRISPYDILYINIVTLDKDANELFNPHQGEGYFTGTQQMFGDLTSQYINGYQVEPNGTITFPIIGTLSFSGLTLIEAQNRIREKALEYLKEPSVQVKTLSFKVNVTGEVVNPGMYYTYQGKMNILEAISLANGITNYAKLKKVVVVRQGKYDTRTILVDLTKKSLFESEAYFLQPNDMVYITPDKFKSNSLNTPAYSLVLSAISTISTILIAISLQ